MMYSNMFAAAIKVGGKVLRENGDTVTLPFGSEYSIHLKNLNSVRAMARVTIDGDEATEGTWLIVPANGSIDLERFVKGGNLTTGNRFKFIERTSNVENFRGIGLEDGLIRVEYKFEVPQYNRFYFSGGRLGGNYDPNSGARLRSRGLYKSAPSFGSITRSVSSNNSDSDSSQFLGETSCYNLSDSIGATATNNVSYSVTSSSVPPVNDQGITVEGSVSNQQFYEGAWFPTESSSHVIVFKLRGAVGEQLVQAPITVNTKSRCKTCGRQNKGNAKFCTECGTSLQIVGEKSTIQAR